MSDWQPIKTAPKGKYVLVVVDVNGCNVVGEAWQREDGGWYWANLDPSPIWPTHWMHAPAGSNSGGYQEALHRPVKDIKR